MNAPPYGPGADWVRKVLASGTATLVHDGTTVDIERPEVVRTAEVAHHLPPSEPRTLRWFGVEACRRVGRPGPDGGREFI